MLKLEIISLEIKRNMPQTIHDLKTLKRFDFFFLLDQSSASRSAWEQNAFTSCQINRNNNNSKDLFFHN